MSTTVMQDSSRSPAKVKDGGDSETERASTPAPPADASAPAPTGEAKPAARFVGHAMKALFESSDVSIKRGDETRVMSRAQEALAQIQRKTSPLPPPPAPNGTQSTSPSVRPAGSISSRPPAPRVDAVLWIVLAVGLFAIAGWMVAYAL